ncbi:restriction endonuclease subunit S [Pseudemcibacter aquimaris]|uniref:restriction endonuclease subunit S n=1 Tax=Pseudemcibacter aquimaris TaxID=2857064 RepID=UPI002012DB52|nr:restriction endonuclease subunit S [Pseudemcibacter aquimaris]MCC3860739.1 restriction endonuclease subunit S [Pseudemcibacter aquimaris]WDU59558.1 restriction endonuclease subunit S [Pseudemcibacter aquimaris]
MQLTEKQKSEGWRIVKFGEIAKSVSKRVDPADTDLEVYVGLEHLDPDNLRITRRGVPSDVKGQKLLVKPGQIIFGKRRAYQRKVAVADFEGICSAHAMVLEAIPEAVVPEYLPFFMQSDMFMERAVAISEGSLSPTIKWKTLANQEFPLPPRPRQEEMLEIFEKIEDKLFQIDELLKRTDFLLGKIRAESVHDDEYKKINLGDIVKFKGGSGFKPKYQGNKQGEIPFIKVADMNHGENSKYIIKSDNWISGEEKKIMKATEFPAGSVVFAKVGAALLLNRRRILKHSTIIDNNMMAALPSGEISTEYLYHFLNTIDFATFVRQGAVPSVNQSDMASVKINLPDLEKQESISETLNGFEASIDLLEEKKDKTLNIRKLLIKNTLEEAA